MRVVLDTNILARSFYRFNGPAREVLERVSGPPHVLVLSTAVLDELREVLNYPRLRNLHRLSDEAIARFLDRLQREALILNVPAAMVGILDDPRDATVLAAAVVGHANVICTLDRHFYQASVREYCAQGMIEVMDDIALLARLREGNE